MLRKRLVSVGLLCLLAAACGSGCTSSFSSGQTFSDPEDWDELFMLGAISTEQCEADSLENVGSRMTLQGPYSAADYEDTANWRGSRGPIPASGNRVSRVVKENITDAHSIYSFLFVDRSDSSRRGVTGYLVAYEGCIAHVEVTGCVF
jgi:hypothetical protein